MRILSTFLFVLLFTSSFVFAQDASRTQMVETSSPLNIQDNPTALFLDDMNGDNTLAGIQARGWVFVDVDGAGTTTVFQGNATVFNAYEGPTTGYIGENFNGAFNGGLLIDQWLISPPVTVTAGDTLKFWHRSPDASTWPDPLQVKVSTTGGITPAAFDVQLGAFNGSTTGWQQFKGNFPTSGTVRFAVRYYTTNGGPAGSESDYVGMDYFEVIAGSVPPPPPLFFDNFDSYTAGNRVACSNPTFWTTWSNLPCSTTEDPVVSSTYAYSGTNSAKIVLNNDLVKKFGATALTSGKYKISFRAYIPTGKAGYFNTLATFAGNNSSWGMDVYFNTTGVCSVFAGSATANISTNYPHDAWFLVEHIVDLGANQAQLIVNGTSVTTWQWTLGSIGAGCPLTLDASDLFGATANDEMYVDNYTLEDLNVVPVELTSFVASSDNRNVNLNWSTATELNNSGFQIERSSGSEYQVVGFVAGHGTTTEVQNYSYSDQNVNSGSYSYRLKQIDFDGTFEYSNTVEVEVLGVLEFTLGQNYPNPFNPATTINFSLAEPSFVKLAVYNLLGEEVKVLKNEYMSAGTFNASFDAASLPSGMYLYKIETAQYSSVRKMMLMK